jgi:hypothetical protein
VISITVKVGKLRSDVRQYVLGGLSVPDKFSESTAWLEELVHEIMKETDPVLYDQLAEEIWRVLAERERLARWLWEAWGI